MEPTKQEISQVFKRLRAIGPNKACFDCGTKNPTWASVTFGVFICIDCSAVHRSLGVHVSFVRSTQLDSWTWMQLRAMQVGGNAAATAYFRSHGCTAKEAHAKYNSRAANMYREKLNTLALNTQKTYGTQLFFDLNDPNSPTSTDDFFSSLVHPVKEQNDMSSLSLEMARVSVSHTQSPQTLGDTESSETLRQPSVDTLHVSQTTKTDGRSSIINKRKPTSKPSLGGGGLGAQKVTHNFSEIEKQAEENQKVMEQQQQASLQPRVDSVGPGSYQKSDFEIQIDRQKMSSLDPMKAKQAERLGMGLSRTTATSNSSHSAFSSMSTIDQVNPIKSSYKDTRSTYSSRNTDPFDDFSMDEPLSRFDSDLSYKSYDRGPSYTGGGGRSLAEQKFSSHSAFSAPTSTKHSSASTNSSSSTPSSSYSSYKGRSNKSSQPPESTNTAQDRFGNSKSISSDQFFNRERSNDDAMDGGSGSDFSRFSSSRAISSDDYFGRTPKRAPSNNSGSEIGSVVSKIASAANGVWGSFQEQYQNYTHKH